MCDRIPYMAVVTGHIHYIHNQLNINYFNDIALMVMYGIGLL